MLSEFYIQQHKSHALGPTSQYLYAKAKNMFLFLQQRFESSKL